MKKYFYLFSLILIIGVFFVLPRKTEGAFGSFRIISPTDNSLTAGNLNAPYSFPFQVPAAETAGTTWEIKTWNWGGFLGSGTKVTAICGSGALVKLPSEIGLTLDTNTGLLSGTSTLMGTFGFSVQVYKTWIVNDIKAVCLTINAPTASAVPPPPAAGTPGGASVPGPAGGSGASLTRACQGQSLSIDNPNFYQVVNKNKTVETAAYDGLVPCGKCLLVGGTKTGNTISGSGTYVSCQFCHFFVMFGGMVNFLIWKIAIPAAILLLVIGGAMFVFAAGQPGLVKRGTDIMKSVVIGLVIMFAAWLVVNTIFAFLGVAGWTGLQQGWFQINCPINI